MNIRYGHIIFVLIHASVIMTSNAQNTTPNNTLSTGDNSSISSKTSQVDRLEKRRDFWDAWYFWLIGGTAILVAATVSVQVVGRSINKKLSLAQAELIREKDRRLSIELKNKDLEIEAAKGIASGADERAGKANEAAGRANEAAGQANERAATLEADAADARLKQQELAFAAEELRKANEAEKRKRINLAVSLLPRNFMDQSGAVAILQAFKDMAAIIEYRDENEPLEMAEQINFVLLQAGWKVSGKPDAVRSTRDGITAEAGSEGLIQEIATGDANKVRSMMQDKDVTVAAGRALLTELVKSGIEVNVTLQSESARLARVGIDVDSMVGTRLDVPLKTVLVSVGRKPATELMQALKELGPGPQPTLVDSVIPGVSGLSMGGNRARFPK